MRNLSAGLLVILGCSLPGGALRFVDDDAAPGGDGRSWATAYRFLQDALAEAEADPAIGEIRVAAGTYRPDRSERAPRGTGDRGASFRVRGGLTCRGGFGGASILDGDLAGDDGPGFANRADNSRHVVEDSGAEPMTIAAFTISGGNDDGPASGGGGMRTDGGASIGRCTLIDNQSSLAGGAVAVSGSAATPVTLFSNCAFLGNAAANGGGAIFVAGAPVELESCSFGVNAGLPGASVRSATPLLVVRNSVATGISPLEGAFAPSISFSITDSAFAGANGNLHAVPFFVDPFSDLRLRAGSPCIDAGDRTAVADAVDLDGNLRLSDDPCHVDGGAGRPPRIDIGAYERPGSSCDLDGSGGVGIADLLILLPAWGPCADCLPAGCPGDFDGDCAVGITDLLMLLAMWR